MENPQFRRVSRSKDFTSYSSFSVCEFEVPPDLKVTLASEILDAFIKHPYFRDEPQINLEKTEYSYYFTHMAFHIENLSVNDFKEIDEKDIEEIVLLPVKTVWQKVGEHIKNDYINTYFRSRSIFDNFQIDAHKVFYIDMNWFKNTDKLTDIAFVWQYALTFIVINQEKTRLILLDYGMD